MRTRCNKKLVNVDSAGTVPGPVRSGDVGVVGAGGVHEGKEGGAALLEDVYEMGQSGSEIEIDHRAWGQ